MSASAELTRKQRRILEYLRRRKDDQTYFKSRLIGEELDMTAKEVGSNIAVIADSERIGDIDIEPWGYSSGTTWEVTVG